MELKNKAPLLTLSYLLDKETRHIINEGSTRSGKTYGTMQVLYLIGYYFPNITISVCSMSVPHLKRGAIKDFLKFLKDDKIFDKSKWHGTDFIWSFDNGSKLEFFSLDNSDKVHGASRDYCFVNECQYIPWETISQLQIRTTVKMLYDFNPTHEFWAHKRLKPQSRTKWIHSTYKDNRYLTEAQVYDIESRKNDIDWWNVYGLGLVGAQSGKIFNNYHHITLEDFINIDAPVYFGYDDGYTAPAALVACKIKGSNIYFHECFYKTGMSEQERAIEVSKFVSDGEMVVCDSENPSIVQELIRLKINAFPISKTANLKVSSIANVNSFKKHVTDCSTNFIAEVDEFSWKIDEKTDLQRVNKKNDHLMDAKLYVSWYMKLIGI